jgi:hypothetical protein
MIARSPRWGFCLSFFLMTHQAHSQTTGCTRTINDIALRESLVTNTSFTRTYVLCPNKTYTIGNLHFDNTIIGGQKMIPLQANMKIQCGDSGSRSEKCLVTGGDLQVDGTTLYTAGKGPLDNVILQGITFSNASRYNVWITRPGSVQFDDCEFRVSRVLGSTMIR